MVALVANMGPFEFDSQRIVNGNDIRRLIAKRNRGLHKIPTFFVKLYIQLGVVENGLINENERVHDLQSWAAKGYFPFGCEPKGFMPV